jgi:DNA-binding transcriptional LysR family regulator
MICISIMHTANIGAIDLNLLVALQALLTERHVTRAAARMGLTQPAMSHALGRLRTTLGDPLLVRGQSGLQLTARAASLVDPLDRLLRDASALLAAPTFDPKTSTRRFRIATSDYMEIVLMPRFLEHLSEEAPNIDIVMVRHAQGTAQLDEGEADLMMVPPGPLERSDTRAQRILDEKFVCVVRADHPTVGKKMTLDRYVELGHVLVSPRGDGVGLVDHALAKVGRTRRVAVVVPHFLVAPFLVERTDYVLTVAARIARSLLPAVKLKLLPVPAELDLPGFDVRVVWHERDHADPAHAWLRTRIATVARSI